MRILVTGAGGFVGRRTVRTLASRGYEVVASDLEIGGFAELGAVEIVSGNIADARVQAAALSGVEAVLHLATVPGGAAEQDSELARRINVDATMTLSRTFASMKPRGRFIFASSVAALGDALTCEAEEPMLPQPRLYYGAHKAMIEIWLATLARRGELSALSLRFPGIVARPEAPSGMKSAFISNVFHALLRKGAIELPVSRDATMWVLSVQQAAAALIHALEMDPRTVMPDTAVTLPALSVSMGSLADEICRQSEADSSLVSYVPEQEIEEMFGSFPKSNATSGEKHGFKHDGSLRKLVANALKAIAERSL